MCVSGRMQSPPPALPVRALDLESVYVWIVVAFNVSATAAAAFATQVATTLAPGAPTRSLAVAAVLAAALLRDAPVERDAQLGELHAVLRAGVVVTLGAFLLAQLGACSGDIVCPGGSAPDASVYASYQSRA